MKYFDPANYPSRSTNPVTIYGSVLTLTGSSGTCNITINGILNTTIATWVASTLTLTAAAWVTANYAFYHARGYEVTSAAGVITVTPTYGWDTVNKIKVTVSAAVSGDLTGTLTGVFEPDLAKAKTWQVSFGQHIAVKRPRSMREGDKIRLELLPTGAYTTTFPTDSTSYYFPGGTENVQTSTALDTVTGTVNISMFPREDRITLTGTGGTCTIVAGGLSKVCTWGASSLTQTAADFVTSWADAYDAIGLTVTAASGVLTFKVKDGANPKATANFYKIPTVTLLTTNLFGTVVNVPAGRIVVDAAAQNHIQ
jgi:hypothetical protein